MEKKRKQEEIIKLINEYVEEYDRLPTARELCKRNGLPDRSTIERVMGMTWGQFTRQYYPKLARPRCNQWDKDKILTTLDQFIQMNGRLPTTRELSSHRDLFHHKTFKQIMGVSWGVYVAEKYPEYVELRELQHREKIQEYRREQIQWNAEKLNNAVMSFVEKYKRLPKKEDFRMENGLPNYTIYCKIAERYMTECLEKRIEQEFKMDLK